MSDVETALTGAEVAPVVSEPTEAAPAPESTPEQIEEQKVEQARDDKGRFVPQERLNEVTRHRREAERRADALQREVDHYRSQPAQQPPSNDAPTLEAYGYDTTAWQAALTDHVSRKVMSQAEQHRQQADYQRSQEQVAEQFDESRSATARS